MTLKRAFALAAVVAAAAFAASAQTRELNPTVKVLARPQSPVPPECATDQTVLPALEVEAPAEPVTAAPPSSDLRTSLRRLQAAAEANDYAAFKSAFAEAKRAVAAHPAGGERNAANDALQVFADIARVWDYAMASPTGGFFDAASQGGSLLNLMKRYPDYGRAIADQTINSGGRTLYPTPETRRFLARESARRLTRLGVSTPAQVARGTQPAPVPRHPVTVPPPVKKPVQVAAKPPAAKTTAPKKTATKTETPKTQTPKTATPKPAAKTAKSTPPATPKSVAIKATPVPKPKPAAPPPVKVADTSTMPPPIVATPQPKAPATTTTATSSAPTATTAPITTTTAPVTTTTAPPAATTSTTDTTVSTTTSAPTDTAATAAPDTSATSTAVPPSKQNGNMNLILAVVLILVGIGVLVVLFRASD